MINTFRDKVHTISTSYIEKKLKYRLPRSEWANDANYRLQISVKLFMKGQETAVGQFHSWYSFISLQR